MDFLKTPSFFDKAIVCGGTEQIDQQWFDIQKEIHDEAESLFIEPHCYKCNVELKVGDHVDGFHPYHQEYNSCKGCKDGCSSEVSGGESPVLD